MYGTKESPRFNSSRARHSPSLWQGFGKQGPGRGSQVRWAGDQEGARGRDRQQQLDLVRKEPPPKLCPFPALPYNPLPLHPQLCLMDSGPAWHNQGRV